MPVKFLSSVLFVKDIHTARHFYEDLLNQKVEIDFGPNIGFVGGLSIWQSDHAYQTIFGASGSEPDPLGCKNFELYFETEELDQMLSRVTQANVSFVHPIHEQPWGQRVFRIVDPDGHIVELGEPMPAVIQRLLSEGMSLKDAAQRTGMPLEIVEAVAKSGSSVTSE